MFESLSTRLQDVFKSLRGEARLTEGTVDTALREIRLALLEADVNFRVVKAFIERVRAKAGRRRGDAQPDTRAACRAHRA
jgi:signal recognition particle subunit SRP54